MFLFTLVDSSGERVDNKLYEILVWVTFGISMIHILFPMDRVNKALFEIHDEVTESQSYDEARLTFNTDYDIQNPITHEHAVKELLESVHQHHHHNSSIRQLKNMLKSNTTNQTLGDITNQVVTDSTRGFGMQQMTPTPYTAPNYYQN